MNNELEDKKTITCIDIFDLDTAVKNAIEEPGWPQVIKGSVYKIQVKGPSLKILIGGDLAGKIVISHEGDISALSKILVQEKYQKKGLGYVLAQGAYCLAEQRKAQHVKLGETATSKGFWAKLGMSEFPIPIARARENLRSHLPQSKLQVSAPPTLHARTRSLC